MVGKQGGDILRFGYLVVARPGAAPPTPALLLILAPQKENFY